MPTVAYRKKGIRPDARSSSMAADTAAGFMAQSSSAVAGTWPQRRVGCDTLVALRRTVQSADDKLVHILLRAQMRTTESTRVLCNVVSSVKQKWSNGLSFCLLNLNYKNLL